MSCHVRPPSGRSFASRASYGNLAEGLEGPGDNSAPSSPSSPLDKNERLILYTYLTTWGLPGDSMTEEGDVDLLAAAAASAPSTRAGQGENEEEEEEGGLPPLPPLLAGTLGCSSFGALLRSRCPSLGSKEDAPLLSALLDMLAEMHAVGDEERKRRKVGREQKRQKLSKLASFGSAAAPSGAGATAKVQSGDGDGDEETASDAPEEGFEGGGGGGADEANNASGAGGVGVSPLAAIAREVPLRYQILSGEFYPPPLPRVSMVSLHDPKTHPFVKYVVVYLFSDALLMSFFP